MGAIERRKPVMVPVPDVEPRHRSRRETSQWCRGRIGMEHQWHRLDSYTVFCQDCAKQRWQSKDPSLASQVKALRESAGFTQEALAERISVSVERIKELERTYTYLPRNVRLDTMETLAYVCGAKLVIRFEPKE